MKSRDFVYWLQGYFELQKPKTIGEQETELIRRHLNMVFIHEIDPSMPDKDGTLQNIHDGKTNQESHQNIHPLFDNSFKPDINPPIPSKPSDTYRC